MTILVSDGLNEYQTPARANEFFKFVITNSIPSDGNGGCKSDIKKRRPYRFYFQMNKFVENYMKWANSIITCVDFTNIHMENVRDHLNYSESIT